MPLPSHQGSEFFSLSCAVCKRCLVHVGMRRLAHAHTYVHALNYEQKLNVKQTLSDTHKRISVCRKHALIRTCTLTGTAHLQSLVSNDLFKLDFDKDGLLSGVQLVSALPEP